MNPEHAATHPSFAAELGHAVARGWITQTQADVATLLHYRNNDDAKKCAQETRRHARSWAHIRTQLITRIADVTAHNLQRGFTPNAIRAEAHNCNQTGVLSEKEVNAIIAAAEAENLHEQQRQARRRQFQSRGSQKPQDQNPTDQKNKP